MNSFSLKLRRWLRRGESGQSVILLAIGFIALVGFVGITTDVALMFVRYSQLSRAVDAAAIAAANQMRQDRTQASLGIAARQFIELYGLNPTDVLVDTCLSIDEIITDELCSADQAKLVRVTAQIVSPTVFMRLLGFQDFVLQASSLSQTAALDVVVIMDASESMSNLTTIESWADIRLADGVTRDGQGVVYRPPRLDQVYVDKYPSTMTNRPNESQFWMGSNPPYPPGVNPLESVLGTWQQNVNNRLFYADGEGNVPGFYGADPAYNVQYDKLYFNGGLGGNYGTQKHPRLECRVRFFQLGSDTRTRSWNGEYNEATKTYVSLLDNRDTTKYDASTFGRAGFTWFEGRDPNKPNPNPFVPSTRWNGFVPTYNYHGCCNDPNGDKNFTDLICQPFKQARDAVVLFMDRVDFGRGDRMAFVTFDRTAFLINPFGYIVDTSGNCPTNNTKESCRPGAMIESVKEAKLALQTLVGVRAEPNFYTFKPNNIVDPDVRVTAQWTGFAAGLNRTVDFARTGTFANPVTTYGSTTQNGNGVPAEMTTFPVWSDCPFKVAGLTRTDRTFFVKGVANSSLPNPSVSAGWASYGHNGMPLYTGVGGYNAANLENYNVTNMSYDYWASCRGSNIGAGLREGSNALLNPKTIRKSGTVWVMILLANGGAGGSDPVRRNRADLIPSQPYAYSQTSGLFGAAGAYGAHGLCPYGTPNKAAELMLPGNDARSDESPAAAFPYCSDESPRTRTFCNFRPLFTVEGLTIADPLTPITRDINTGAPGCDPDTNSACFEIPPMGDETYIFFDPTPPLHYGTNGPQSAGEEQQWNRDNNNLYDVDLTGCQNPGDATDQQLYYDADDYAHDWADYIGLRKDETSSELLPTIFTIGFGTEYEVRSLTTGGTVLNINDNANIQAICSLNASDCLGEQLLRYIADVGDNNKIDNDYYQSLVRPLKPEKPTGKLEGQTTDTEGFGPRDPCQRQDQGPNVGSGTTAYYTDLDAMYGHLKPQTSCGNYYYAPDYNQLQIVFDDIASRMFTRLSR